MQVRPVPIHGHQVVAITPPPLALVPRTDPPPCSCTLLEEHLSGACGSPAPAGPAPAAVATMPPGMPTVDEVEQLVAAAARRSAAAHDEHLRLRAAAIVARFQAGEPVLRLAESLGLDRATVRHELRAAAAVLPDLQLRESGPGGAPQRVRHDGQRRLPHFTAVRGQLEDLADRFREVRRAGAKAWAGARTQAAPQLDLFPDEPAAAAAGGRR